MAETERVRTFRPSIIPINSVPSDRIGNYISDDAGRMVGWVAKIQEGVTYVCRSYFGPEVDDPSSCKQTCIAAAGCKIWKH